jgi:hypothetical protein
MLLYFKRFLLVAAIALLAQTSFGFALLGPRDTWQTSALGYDPQGDLGDIGGPKNLGEEWRWVLPEISYAFDASFINFFGTNGVKAVEDAIFLFNKDMTNFSGMTDDDLRRKPRDTKRIHSTAQALGVLDLKSYAMGLLAEQLGLAGAVRWTWALRDRQVFNNNITNYAVIQRNFDPFTLKPTRYVNDHKWTYFIGTFPTGVGNATYEDAAEIAIDQAGDNPFISSAVSAAVGEDLLSTGLRQGEYYSALSRDDIGGLRYMYTRFNINSEFLPLATPRDSGTFAPAIRMVDTSTLIFTNGFDAFTFFTNALFTNPNNLQGQFTNLVILSTNISVTNIVTTQFVVTNLVSSGLFTNRSLPTLISNQDLFLFSLRSRTNDAATLRGFYPQLIITRTNDASFETLVTENFFITNSPYGVPGEVYVATNKTTNIVPVYSYQYANVITNYASATTDLDAQEVVRHPLSTPGDFLLTTNHHIMRVDEVSGGFYILDRTTNAALIGYTFYDQNNVPLTRVTNIIGNTNLVFQFTNTFDPTDVRILNLVNNFTNVVYGAFPIFLNGASGQQTVPVFFTNQVARFDYTFGTNLLVFPPANGNTNVILQTITFTNGGPLQVTQSNVFTDIPKGTVLILDTNQFVLAGPRIETFGLVTNVIDLFTNAATGEFIVQQLIYQTNSIQFAVFPVVFVTPSVPQLHPGVDSLKFVRHPFHDYLDQAGFVATNTYTISVQTNGVRSFQTVRRIAGPDIIFSTFDQTTTGGFPVATARSLLWQSTAPGGAALIQPGATFDRGPGEVVGGGSTISFSTLSPSWIVQTPGALTEETSFLFLQWGSFDSKTLVPRLYPEDFTGQLKILEDIALHRTPAP